MLDHGCHPKPVVNKDGRSIVISRRSILLISAALLAQRSSSALAASRSNPIKQFDTDADGTLDRREQAGRLTARETAATDPDHDGTLTLDE